MKLIDEVAHVARRARKPLNVLITIRAPRGVSDVIGKRAIQLKIGRIGQALIRRGQPSIGVTVYELTPGGYLHAHLLLHVDRANDDVLARFVDGVDVHARPAVRSDLEYITKQRQWLGPYEPPGGRPYQKGASIIGPRFSLTKAARALVEPLPRPVTTVSAPTPEPPPLAIPAPSEASGQILLFAALPELRAPVRAARSRPVARLKIQERTASQVALPIAHRADLVQVLQGLGPTKVIAELTGYSRQHISNVIVGRFGASAPLRRHILELARAA